MYWVKLTTVFLLLNFTMSIEGVVSRDLDTLKFRVLGLGARLECKAEVTARLRLGSAKSINTNTGIVGLLNDLYQGDLSNLEADLDDFSSSPDKKILSFFSRPVIAERILENVGDLYLFGVRNDCLGKINSAVFLEKVVGVGYGRKCNFDDLNGALGMKDDAVACLVSQGLDALKEKIRQLGKWQYERDYAELVVDEVDLLLEIGVSEDRIEAAVLVVLKGGIYNLHDFASALISLRVNFVSMSKGGSLKGINLRDRRLVQIEFRSDRGYDDFVCNFGALK